MKGTGNGDKTATTGFAEIPVEYIEHDTSVHYTTSTNLGSDTADSRMLVVRYNGDVLIDAGATITPTTRKRGMFMYVDGALTVNGTISMTARGAANVPGDRILILTDSGTSYEIPAVGGAANGGVGINGATGGGAKGGGVGGDGTSGTSYSGGSGGGGGCSGSASWVGFAAAMNGGPGGSGITGTCSTGGGAGNPGGGGAVVGGAGTGGLLIIYAKTVSISSTGSINANGVSGGVVGTVTGGGSGGGSVNIFYQNDIINNGVITSNGGLGGSNGNGGVGTVRINQIVY